ncbi:hypothetical protein SOVF_114390 isoform C, partial [Spinacia oleracea]
ETAFHCSPENKIKFVDSQLDFSKLHSHFELDFTTSSRGKPIHLSLLISRSSSRDGNVRMSSGQNIPESSFAAAIIRIITP